MKVPRTVWYVFLRGPYANYSATWTLVLPVKYLFLSSGGLSPCSLVLRSLYNHPFADGRIECKEDLNASRILLVLENSIKSNGAP